MSRDERIDLWIVIVGLAVGWGFLLTEVLLP
jgi:hypothetical protein